MNIVLSPMASKRDAYDILKVLFRVKIGISLFALICGRLALVVSLFMICSRAVVESVFGLWIYINQDVDDEYYVKFGKRKASQSYFFVGKIGQAAAPVLGWLMFVVVNTSQNTITNSTTDINSTATVIPSGSGISSNSSVMVDDTRLFYWMVLVMLTSGSLQLLAWSKYSLHGNYLKDIKILASNKPSYYTSNNSNIGLNSKFQYGDVESGGGDYANK